MKNLTLTAACLILATMSTSVTMAQRSAPGRQGPNAQHGRGDSSDALMRQAAKEVAKAHDMLQGALPIYHGNRVDAMQDCRDAQKQIAQGLRYDRQHDDGQFQGRSGGDNDSASRYSKEQVRKSNNTLKKAAEVLEHAKKELQRAGNDFGGHRVEAIKQIDQALVNIRQALASVNSRH